MYETFENLPESKRNHILQVCMEEFALNGYRNASTNTIVKRLGISKGALFLYFRDKKNLYLYLVEHSLELFINKFLTYLNENRLKNFDFFDIFDNLEGYYKKIVQENFHVLIFMVGAIWGDVPEELMEEIEKRHKHWRDPFMHMINIDNFREGIDLERVKELLLIVSDHVKRVYVKKAAGDLSKFSPENVKEMLDLYKTYVRIIQYGIYEK